MQKILILASILLLTLKSFGQIDTKIPYNSNKDSVVTIPKQVAIWMIQDIAKSDSYAEEIKLLNNNINLKQDIIYKQDTIITIQKQQLFIKKKELDAYEELTTQQEIQIISLNKSVRTQTRLKKFWRITTFIAPCITGYLVHYHWKNNKAW